MQNKPNLNRTGDGWQRLAEGQAMDIHEIRFTRHEIMQNKPNFNQRDTLHPSRDKKKCKTNPIQQARYPSRFTRYEKNAKQTQFDKQMNVSPDITKGYGNVRLPGAIPTGSRRAWTSPLAQHDMFRLRIWLNTKQQHGQASCPSYRC